MRIRRTAYFLFAISAIYLFSLCAHPVSPGGGLKDTEPPIVVKAVPENYSTNFDQKSIIVTFNEFVKLNKLQQQLLISPPTNELPEIKLKGKSIHIKFLEDLKPETTYSVYFGDAIVDLTEGNPIAGYTYVFSTGSILDSMSITGQVVNAFDLKPSVETFVMLYLDDNDTIPLDSLPYFVRPYYISRTNKQGTFRLQNLRNEQYKLFAINDMNSNFLFDLPGEAIAFSDSLISPEFVMPILKDTLEKADSLVAATKDSLINIAGGLLPEKKEDSLIKLTKSSKYLYLFSQVDSTQKLLRAELTKAGMLTFAFRFPASDIEVESLYPVPDSFQVMKYYNKNADSLYWYFSQQVLDSLNIHITKDSTINDTVSLSLIPRAKPTAKKASKLVENVNSLRYSSSAKYRKLDLNKYLDLKFEEPVVWYQMRDSNRFINNKDTIYNQVAFTKMDSLGLNYRMSATFEAGGSYDLSIPDSVFVGFSGKWNDTILMNFKVPTLEDYGNLVIDIQIDSAETMIVQLLNTKDLVLAENQLHKSEIVHFNTLNPGKYKIKVIQDRNKNGRWDSGNYAGKIQPERVNIFPKELEIRANWDLEEEWDLKGKFK